MAGSDRGPATVRVLVLTHVFPRTVGDPSAPFLLTWVRALRGAGCRVAVVAPHDAGLPARHHVGGIGVRRARYAPDRLERLAYRGEMHRLARTPAGPPLVAALVAALATATRAQLRAARPDVLHVHWWLPGAVAARLALMPPRTVDVPVVVTVHGTDVALIEQRPVLAPLARWALAVADRVEAVSTDLADRLERAVGRTADAVAPMPLAAAGPDGPDGPAAGSSTASSTAPLRVLAVGRLVPEKGFADLVAAAARCAVPVALTIVGDGPERDRLAAAARALGVDLRLPGRLPPDALGGWYATADVVAQPSHREGFGLVAAEALLAGVPVVATDVGGARDVVGAGGVGSLVAVGDVDGLARVLDRVAADPVAARATARDRARTVRALLAPEAAAARALAGYRTIGVM